MSIASPYDQLIRDARQGYQESGVKPICRAFYDNEREPTACCAISAAHFHKMGRHRNMGDDSTVDWAVKQYGLSLNQVWELIYGYDNRTDPFTADWDSVGYRVGRQFRDEMNPISK